MKLTFKNIGITGLAVVAAASSFLMMPSSEANAATATVNPGSSIQTAINSAASGDTIKINAGTYIESLVINKPLTLEGVGAVVIKTKSPTVGKGVDIKNTQNVTLKNLIFDGESGDPMTQTGIDINSVKNITLDTVTAKNYQNNGFSVVAQQDASYVRSSNVTFTNITSENNAWAGVAFYTKSTAGFEVALNGISFNGTTTLSDNGQTAVRFGDTGDTAKTTGPNGAPVALGEVHFSNNAALILNNTNSSATVSSESTVNGRMVVATDFTGLGVTLVDPAAPVVPRVPNTSTVR